MPALPFGPTAEHRGFGAGYVDLPVEVHGAVIAAVLRSPIEQGFRRFLLWRGCGGHKLEEVVAQFTSEHDDVRIAMPAMPFGEMWCRLGDASVPGGHADSFTTSIALALWPASVRPDVIPGPSRTPDWDVDPLDFTVWSDSGVIGDARFGSAHLGKQLHREAVSWLADRVEELTR